MTTDIILLGHGSGGRLSHQLLDDVITPALGCDDPALRHDAALLPPVSGQLAFTTDSYVVDPLFFPGGNIGDLAVNGTVNDLAMMGATPRWMSVGLILEEGFSQRELKEILYSMRQAADSAGIRIVTGDTKVVPRGKGDRVFINTSGVGVLGHNLNINGSMAQPGDRIIISGTIADHGVAVMASREGIELDASVASDSAPLNHLVEMLISRLGDTLHVLRDPTRGGVATTIKEIAHQSAVDLRLLEAAIPIKPAVRDVCSILGLDPLYVANEGKLLAIVAPEAAECACETLRSTQLGADAAIIGTVTATGSGRVALETAHGGVKVIEMLSGQQLPRIC